ncbi:hypothetical protein DTO166G4_7664 [Paecilomyces variotii]|nr:hypothetical protein DTO032I3_3368 [Paecilomyces variotii]KAJ9204940.1 hypothetical protein DTO164E3_1563 [Paecilomyces variotii]KAJ9210704.1 hypothetical protein DTO166G4_7664 [Paecilomyces variotii]KAJ9225619.1 hypothetical protein DTO169C6_2055 [Paecilomyces variotii]KAJ9243094.1 hypothetical protein DTO166G5_198 [Paecilomyces variotii]
MESSEMAEAEARMAVGDDPQEQDGRDREGTQCVVDLELLGGGGGENQGLEKAGELGSLGGSKVVDLDDGGAKAISYSTMISKLQAVVQSDCQFGYVFAEPQGARPWFRPVHSPEEVKNTLRVTTIHHLLSPILQRFNFNRLVRVKAF